MMVLQQFLPKGQFDWLCLLLFICRQHQQPNNPFGAIFAMAKIRMIGHDHQAPFWLFLVVVLGYQAVTRGENRLPHTQYTLDPPYFYRF